MNCALTLTTAIVFLLRYILQWIQHVMLNKKKKELMFKGRKDSQCTTDIYFFFK